MKPDEKRKKIMRKGRRCGHEVATSALGLPEETERLGNNNNYYMAQLVFRS